jgi:hypothetical protein
MNTPLLTTLALAALAAGAPALAENRQLIDDFSTGHFQAKPIKKGSASSNQIGSMVGGSRSTTVTLCSTDCSTDNPYAQTVAYSYVSNKAQAGDNAFVQAAGFKTHPRIDQGYGPMHVNFSAYDRVRLNFVGLSAPMNFNLLMFTDGGRGQNGCNLPELNQPFSVELPYSGFVQENGGFMTSDITDLAFVYQSGSAIGSVEFGIRSIEVSDTPQAGAIVCSLTGR